MKRAPESIPEIAWVEKFSVLLDSRFTLPGTKFKFGLDPIIGLIPVAGNVVTMVVSSFLLLIMARHGASRKVLILMTLNILIDTIIGIVPVLGNIFDFGFKSNLRNIQLLKAHYFEGKYQGSGTWIILLVILIISLLVFGIFFGFYKLFAYLIELWQNFSF